MNTYLHRKIQGHEVATSVATWVTRYYDELMSVWFLYEIRKLSFIFATVYVSGRRPPPVRRPWSIVYE
jgi:hypothetical protein